MPIEQRYALVAFVGLSLWFPAVALSQSAVTTAAVQFKVLKISAGPAGGEANGTFALTEERSVFSRSTDKQVVVFFQWEAKAGPHKLVAQWRSPDGSVSSSSALDYLAPGPRFGANWPLYLSPTMPLGTWSVEVTLDGQPAGRYTFEIRDEKVESAPPVKPPLTPSELYETLSRSFITLQRSGYDGQSLGHVAGFSSTAGQVFTSASVLDSAIGLTAILPDGSRRELPAVLAWSRRGDWAVLGPIGSSAPERLTTSRESKVGDRVFTLENSVAGGRVLRAGAVTGLLENPETGKRLIVGFPEGPGTTGSPVVDEFGQLIGLMGGAGVAGAIQANDVFRLRGDLSGTTVVPLSLITLPDNPRVDTLADLLRRDEVSLPLHGAHHIVSGGFARGISKSPVKAIEQRDDFSVRDKEFVVFVNWSPHERLRGETRLKVYDARNSLLFESKPAKSDLRKDRLVLSMWPLTVPSAPGFYRADVFMNDKPIWRGFVAITQ